MEKSVLYTEHAPQAIGAYSQAVRAGNTVYISGQIGLEPATGLLLEGFEAQAHRVFGNLRAICQSAGGDLADIVKLTIFVTDLANFAKLNEIMAEHFSAPFPARAAVQAAALPKGAVVEADAIMVLPD